MLQEKLVKEEVRMQITNTFPLELKIGCLEIKLNSRIRWAGSLLSLYIRLFPHEWPSWSVASLELRLTCRLGFAQPPDAADRGHHAWGVSAWPLSPRAACGDGAGQDENRLIGVLPPHALKAHVCVSLPLRSLLYQSTLSVCTMIDYPQVTALETRVWGWGRGR